MPSSKGYVRNYNEEYKDQKARGEVGTGSSSGNAKRHRLRRQVEKMKGNLPATQDVDHIKPLSKGGSNTMKNARVVPQEKNTSFKRKRDGSIA